MHLQTSKQFKKSQDYSIGVRKSIISEVQADPNARVITFVITSEDVDRDLDRVILSGINFDHYNKNRTVLLEHDHTKVIGKCIDLKIQDGKCYASVEFVPADNCFMGAIAEGVYQMCKSGFYSATSIGFNVLKAEFATEEERGAGTYDVGADFLEIDLFEFSIVSVPANPFALIVPSEPTQQQELDVAEQEELAPDPEQDDEAEKSALKLNTGKGLWMHRSRLIRLLED